eukprot:5524-Eustigmatos_ZCMA.PRE.1
MRLHHSIAVSTERIHDRFTATTVARVMLLWYRSQAMSHCAIYELCVGVTAQSQTVRWQPNSAIIMTREM